MKYNLKIDEERCNAESKFKHALKEGKSIELKEIKKLRTVTQNSALHLYFTFVAYELNNLGLEFHYQGLTTQGLTSRYTDNIVKEFVWKPIQMALFDIKSTTKLDTKQINEIIDVITKYFGDKGISINFPSIESLTNKK